MQRNRYPFNQPCRSYSERPSSPTSRSAGLSERSTRADIIFPMYTPQAGIFALGTSSHAYLEFGLRDAKKCQQFASALAAIRDPRTTTGGLNFVIGFRPELWNEIAPDQAPAGVEGFNKEIRGTEGFVMPC